MKIRHLELPSGLSDGIAFLIDANWSPEQAIAVFELLDDLRAQIWRHYAPHIQAHLQQNTVWEKAVDDDSVDF